MHVIGRMRGEQHARHEGDQLRADGNFPHQLTGLHQEFPGEDRRKGLVFGRRQFQQRAQRVEARHADLDLQLKAVKLRLGQRICAFHLDRVLGRGDEERLRQPMRLAEARHLSLRHGFEQCRLRARRGAVQLIREQHMREDRSRKEAESALAVDRRLEHARSQNVRRHQVRCELDATEGKIDGLGERLHERGLAQTGRAFDQHVSAAQQGQTDLFDGSVLSEDALLQRGLQLPARGRDLCAKLLGFLRFHAVSRSTMADSSLR
jgi:hypothetical protein